MALVKSWRSQKGRPGTSSGNAGEGAPNSGLRAARIRANSTTNGLVGVEVRLCTHSVARACNTMWVPPSRSGRNRAGFLGGVGAAAATAVTAAAARQHALDMWIPSNSAGTRPARSGDQEWKSAGGARPRGGSHHERLSPQPWAKSTARRRPSTGRRRSAATSANRIGRCFSRRCDAAPGRSSTLRRAAEGSTPGARWANAAPAVSFAEPRSSAASTATDSPNATNATTKRSTRSAWR